MSKYHRRATITVDNMARDLFSRPCCGESGTYTEVLDRLQFRLQNKGDDPRYARVIFAAEGQDKFVEINDDNIKLAGVFHRVSAVRYCLGKYSKGLTNRLSIDRDTLIVVNSEEFAKNMEKVAKDAKYEVRRI